MAGVFFWGAIGTVRPSCCLDAHPVPLSYICSATPRAQSAHRQVRAIAGSQGERSRCCSGHMTAKGPGPRGVRPDPRPHRHRRHCRARFPGRPDQLDPVAGRFSDLTRQFPRNGAVAGRPPRTSTAPFVNRRPSGRLHFVSGVPRLVGRSSPLSYDRRPCRAARRVGATCHTSGSKSFEPQQLRCRRPVRAGPAVTDKIRVVVVDDIAETRDHLAKLLSLRDRHRGRRRRRRRVRRRSRSRRSCSPDVRPDGHQHAGHGRHRHAEQLSATVPTSAIVMMSVQGEADYLRRSMLAGAREFLVKPFSSDELSAAIRQVHVARAREARPDGRHARRQQRRAADCRRARAPATVVTLFSPKGGVGRTTLAVNLAVAIATEHQQRSVALVDASLQFGDVGVLLNLNPKNKSIVDVAARRWPAATPTHRQRARRATAPASACCSRRPARRWPSWSRPSTSGASSTALRDDARPRRRRLPGRCSRTRPWPSSTCPTWSSALLTLEITNIKNIRLFLEVADQLGYARRQADAGAQPRRLGLRHPRRGRRELDRPQDRPHRRVATAGRSSTPSTGACRSCGATSRRRSARTSSSIARGGRRRRRRRGRDRSEGTSPAAALFAWR